jgi:hypothetical protein
MMLRFGHILRHLSTSRIDDTSAGQSMAVQFVASRREEKPSKELNGDGNRTCRVSR